MLIVGTSSFIGEGFDCPALDTLFLAAPITFKNRLVQYIGRITRPHPSKTTATVHDYHDELTPVLASSLRNAHPATRKWDSPTPENWSDDPRGLCLSYACHKLSQRNAPSRIPLVDLNLRPLDHSAMSRFHPS